LKIDELIDTRCILTNARSKEKHGLIREMVELLDGAGRLASSKKALADVAAREKEKGTGLEHAVAVPHCRSEGTERLAAAFAVVPEGIDFGALDGERSRFIFLLISPKSATATHVQALATMARILKQPLVQEALLSAESAEAIERILKEAKV